MTFQPREIPAPDVSLDEARYDQDLPFNLKQATITHARHRWFQVVALGAFTTSQYAKTNGIAAGATMRYQFEHKPDYVTIAVDGRTATTGRCMVFRGEPGGDGIVLGQGGMVTMPAPESGIVSVVNIGTTATFGELIAHAGYDAEIMIDPGL
jgi:hypothetical protein